MKFKVYHSKLYLPRYVLPFVQKINVFDIIIPTDILIDLKTQSNKLAFKRCTN